MTTAEARKVFRVTCLRTKGGRPETGEMLWRRDMDEAEYDEFLKNRREGRTAN